MCKYAARFIYSNNKCLSYRFGALSLQHETTGNNIFCCFDLKVMNWNV